MDIGRVNFSGDENHSYLQDNDGIIIPQLSTGDPGVQENLLTQKTICRVPC